MADHVLQQLKAGTAKPGALADAWLGLRSDRHAMQGFARALQKALERRPPGSADGMQHGVQAK